MSSASWVWGHWFKSQPGLQELKAWCGVNDRCHSCEGCSGLSRTHRRKTVDLVWRLDIFLISRHIDKMYNRCWSLSRKSPWGVAWIYPPTSCPAFSWFTCHAQIAPYDQVTVLTATVLLCPGQIRTRIPPIREDVFRPLSHWHLHCFFFWTVVLFNWSKSKKVNNFAFARVRLELGSLRWERDAQTTELVEWRHSSSFFT